MKLYNKLSIYLGSILIITMLISGFFLFQLTSNSMKGHVFSQLESISILKQNQIRDITLHYVRHAKVLSEDDNIVLYMGAFHNNDTINSSILYNYTLFSNIIPNNYSFILDDDLKKDSEKIELLEELLEDHVQDLIDYSVSKYSFSGAFIVLNDGKIKISTIPELNGQIRSTEEFLNPGENYTIKMFFFDHSLKKPITTIAVPILVNGKQNGVLVILASQEEISSIMIERSGMGETGETFLVNSNYLLVTPSVFIDGIEFNRLLFTEALHSCINDKNSGPIISKDYRGVDALIYYSWMDDLSLCIISKQDYSESMVVINNLGNIMAITMFIALIISTVLSIILSRSLVNPIDIMVKQSISIGQGKFYKNSMKKSNDELYYLQQAINNMSDELEKSSDISKEFNQKLEQEVDEKTKELTSKINDINNARLAVLNMMEDLNETNIHLKDLDEAKTNFLNVASHELKTPLTAMSAYLDVLDDTKGDLTEEQKMGLNAIKRNSDQLKMLINNILEISRIESGRFEVNITEVNVKKKILSVVENLKILAENKNISIKTEIADNIPKIMTDDMRFDEILNNLISNAIKFTYSGSITITADVEKSGKFITMKIIDTGVGIPENKINNLFQNFYQVDSGISRKYGGTGLGLSLTKKIIEHQGGTIVVESLAGKGTTFIVNLPITHEIEKISEPKNKKDLKN